MWPHPAPPPPPPVSPREKRGDATGGGVRRLDSGLVGALAEHRELGLGELHDGHREVGMTSARKGDGAATRGGVSRGVAGARGAKARRVGVEGKC